MVTYNHYEGLHQNMPKSAPVAVSQYAPALSGKGMRIARHFAGRGGPGGKVRAALMFSVIENCLIALGLSCAFKRDLRRDLPLLSCPGPDIVDAFLRLAGNNTSVRFRRDEVLTRGAQPPTPFASLQATTTFYQYTDVSGPMPATAFVYYGDIKSAKDAAKAEPCMTLAYDPNSGNVAAVWMPHNCLHPVLSFFSLFVPFFFPFSFSFLQTRCCNCRQKSVARTGQLSVSRLINARSSLRPY